MSKITFRADDDLVEAVEGLDASKSEVMREALRTYLDRTPRPTASDGSIDGAIVDRVDDLIAERLETTQQADDQGVTVTISVDSGSAPISTDRSRTPTGPSGRESDGATCAQCGTGLSDGFTYCPNCGEQVDNRLFCECGDELRPDWAHCPGCGRRTPSADVL